MISFPYFISRTIWTRASTPKVPEVWRIELFQKRERTENKVRKKYFWSPCFCQVLTCVRLDPEPSVCLQDCSVSADLQSPLLHPSLSTGSLCPLLSLQSPGVLLLCLVFTNSALRKSPGSAFHPFLASSSEAFSGKRTICESLR